MSGTAPEPREVAPEKQETWWKRNHAYFWWFLATVAVGAAGVLSILLLAGITVSLPGSVPTFVHVVVPHDASLGQVVSAAVSWFAGTIALFTFYVNVSQKERHHAALELRERELAEEREKREREVAELQRIEAEFAALANDFAKSDPLARINAAIGLGELARRADPRRVDAKGTIMFDPRKNPETWIGDNGEILDESRPWPNHWRSLKTERNYPYFMRAAHRLAAALYMWEDVPANSQAQRVLREMGEWAKDQKTDEPLIHLLVNALAEANRTAWEQLKVKAELCLAADEKTDLVSLLGLRTELLDDKATPEEIRIVSANIAFSFDLRSDLNSIFALSGRSAQSKAPGSSTSELCENFQRMGQGFWATRVALAQALRNLSEPPDMPGSEYKGKRIAKIAEALQKRRNLDLNYVRMHGTSIWTANIQGAMCLFAHFEGTDCLGVQLQWSAVTVQRFRELIWGLLNFIFLTVTSQHSVLPTVSKRSFPTLNAITQNSPQLNVMLQTLGAQTCWVRISKKRR